MVTTTNKTTNSRGRKKKSNSGLPKISIPEAAEKLGVSEEFINSSVQAIYPNGTAEISLSEFQAIAEALQEKLRESQADDNLVVDTLPREQASEDLNQETQPELINDNLTDLINSQSDDLTEQINFGVINSLAFIQDYTLVFEKVSSALAYASAKQAINNFVKVHRSVFESELESYLNDFATEASDAVKNINQVTAEDFLEKKGIVVPKLKRSVEEILTSYPGLQ